MAIKISQLPELTSFTDDANTLMVLVDLTESDPYLRTKKITVENYLKSALEFGETPNVFYISPTGDDLNDGSSWERAFETIERGLEEANTFNGATVLLEIAPGTYQTKGHLDLPDKTVVRAAHRTVVIRPLINGDKKIKRITANTAATSPDGNVFVTFTGGSIIETANAKVSVNSVSNIINSIEIIDGGIYSDTSTLTANIANSNAVLTLNFTDAYVERNVFRMGSGCFMEGPLFEDWRLDDMENPKEGFAVSFRPGAIIRRAPYAHKIACRTNPYWGVIAPPLDRDYINPETGLPEPNPLVGRGMGVALADGTVCSPYSIFPNIMCWGATPVSHNGIGYCAKNGGLINAINSVSIWSHRHYYALDGGQLILSSCSTQFGDYTLVSKGSRQIVVPDEVSITLSEQPSANATIQSAANTIIDNLWIELDTQTNPNTGNVWTDGWDSEDELYTRRDAATFLQSLGWVLTTGNEKPMLDFAKNLFKTDKDATPVFTPDKLDSFVYSFEYMRDEINALGINSDSQNIVSALVQSLNNTLTNTQKRSEPSTITAIGQTWSSIFAGVALTKIPPAKNEAKIEDSILEIDSGLVIASGQDDQGSAIFVGGMTIDSDTGELGGRPFIQAVNRIANKIVISRSF